MKNLGYIALHRKLLYSDVWKTTSAKQSNVFIVLLLRANHTEQVFDVESSKFLVGPGEIITTYNDIKDLCGKDISYNDVRNSIRKLSELNFIIKTTIGRKNSPRLHIKIINWNKYQKADLPGNLPGNLPPEQPSETVDTSELQKDSKNSLPGNLPPELPPENELTGGITGKPTGKLPPEQPSETVDTSESQKDGKNSLPPEKSGEKTGGLTRYIKDNGIEECSEECFEEKSETKLVGGGGIDGNINNIIGGNPDGDPPPSNQPPSDFFLTGGEEWDEENYGPQNLTEAEKRIVNEMGTEQQPPDPVEGIDQTTTPSDQPQADYSDEKIKAVCNRRGIFHEGQIKKFTELNRNKLHFKGGLEAAVEKFYIRMSPKEKAAATPDPVEKAVSPQPGRNSFTYPVAKPHPEKKAVIPPINVKPKWTDKHHSIWMTLTDMLSRNGIVITYEKEQEYVYQVYDYCAADVDRFSEYAKDAKIKSKDELLSDAKEYFNQ